MTSPKPVFAAALVLTLTACGVEEPPAVDGAAAQNDALVVRQPPAAVQPNPDVLQHAVLLERKSPLRSTISIQGTTSAPHGTPVRMALAFMGCGYWIVGRGEGTVALNQLQVSATLEEEGGYGGPLAIVFVDRDKDGSCDTSKGDELFTAHLESSETAVLNTASLAAADDWLCTVFNHPER